MADFQRRHVETLVGRLCERPDKLIAVFGPRQSGKTTIVRQALQIVEKHSVQIPLDIVDTEGFRTLNQHDSAISLPRHPDMEWLVKTWQGAREKAEDHPDGFILALDEIQTIPNWSRIVKGLWDADRAAGRQLHVIVLGSAPMLIQSGLSESLAGRFELLRVSHWSFDEMVEAFGFDLDEYIYFGGYPGGAPYIREEERWRNYIRDTLINATIEKDILAMTRVDKPALLKQLFELGSLYSGQILPFNRMLGQLQDAGNTTTLSRYLDLLSTSGLITGFQKYAPSKLRIRESSPKLNVCNTALAAVLSDYTFSEAKADRSLWGRLVESAIGAHIYNTAPSNVKAYYWRDRVGHSQLEVDFVLQRGPLTIGIEVKSGPRTGRLRGLDAFKQMFNPTLTLLVGESGISIKEFLATPVVRWFDNL